MVSIESELLLVVYSLAVFGELLGGRDPEPLFLLKKWKK